MDDKLSEKITTQKYRNKDLLLHRIFWTDQVLIL